MKRITVMSMVLAGLIIPALNAMGSQDYSRLTVPHKKTEKLSTTAKVLGVLGLAGVGAGAYYAYDKADAMKKYEQAKEFAKNTYTNARNGDVRMIGGLVGAGVLAVLGYKYLFSGNEQELVVENPNPDAILKTLGAQKNTIKPSKPAGPQEAWLKEIGTLLWELHGTIKNEDHRRNAIRPYLGTAALDPHELLRDEALIERMSHAQKLRLQRIFKAYTQDRIMKAATVLKGSLTDEQADLKLMLSVSAGGRGHDGAEQAMYCHDLLMQCEQGQGLSPSQAKFVLAELEVIKDCEERQENFSQLYNLTRYSPQASVFTSNTQKKSSWGR